MTQPDEICIADEFLQHADTFCILTCILHQNNLIDLLVTYHTMFSNLLLH